MTVNTLFLPRHQEDLSTYQSSKVIPDLRDVGVQADSTRVRIEGIPVLVNLVVQDTDGAPEGWVAAVAVDSLLVCLVGFRILLL